MILLLFFIYYETLYISVHSCARVKGIGYYFRLYKQMCMAELICACDFIFSVFKAGRPVFITQCKGFKLNGFNHQQISFI